MPRAPKSERLAVRITPALKRAVEECADEDHRTVSDWIAMELEQAVQRHKQKKQR
jgi:predicted HicB family RNase H-like nuclease